MKVYLQQKRIWNIHGARHRTINLAEAWHKRLNNKMAILLLLEAVHSYILLTANIEDVQNVAKRLVSTPITEQVGNIVRRAYSVFSDHLGKARPQLRSDNDPRGDIVLAFKPDENGANTEADKADENNQIDDGDGSARRNDQEEFSSLGKSASVYIQKIKQIFENA